MTNVPTTQQQTTKQSPTNQDPINVKQVILVLDNTENLNHHFGGFKKTYLDPMLRSFSNPEEKQKVEFGLVAFRDHARFANFVVQVSNFTTELTKFVMWLENLTFSTGGFGSTAILEGLHAAYNLSKTKPASQTYIVLIANSFPHEVYSCSADFSGDCYDQAKIFGKENIFFSVIAPRKIAQLQQLFDDAKPLKPVEETNSIRVPDSSHLVLLRGITFTLQRPKNAAALNVLWQGNLIWKQASPQGLPKDMNCPLVAAPFSDPNSKVATSLQWPVTIKSQGMCQASQIQSVALKSAEFVEFRSTNQPDHQKFYQQLFGYLTKESLAAVVTLNQTQTLLVVPHKLKVLLVGLIVPKIPLSKDEFGSNGTDNNNLQTVNTPAASPGIIQPSPSQRSPMIAQSPATAYSNFSQPSPSVTPSTAGTTFSQPSPASNFVQPSPASNFVQPSPASNFGQPSPATNFGQPSPASNFGQPSPATNFGQSSSSPSQPTTVFSQPSPATNFGQHTPSPAQNFGFASPATVSQLSPAQNFNQQPSVVQVNNQVSTPLTSISPQLISPQLSQGSPQQISPATTPTFVQQTQSQNSTQSSSTTTQVSNQISNAPLSNMTQTQTPQFLQNTTFQQQTQSTPSTQFVGSQNSTAVPQQAPNNTQISAPQTNPLSHSQLTTSNGYLQLPQTMPDPASYPPLTNDPEPTFQPGINTANIPQQNNQAQNTGMIHNQQTAQFQNSEPLIGQPLPPQLQPPQIQNIGQIQGFQNQQNPPGAVNPSLISNPAYHSFPLN